MIEITREPIDPNGLIESVRHHDAGAIVLFLGTVRELTDQRRTAWLEYEAYGEMAQRELEELVRRAGERWPIIRCAISHRLGRLELGDVAVGVAVSTPHRQEAFEAGQWLMDTLKSDVPIWKCENWQDGTRQWVHPNPPEAR